MTRGLTVQRRFRNVTEAIHQPTATHVRCGCSTSKSRSADFSAYGSGDSIRPAYS